MTLNAVTGKVMNESYLSIIIIVLVALLIMAHNKSNIDCRSHDSFKFICHQNHNNTDIYLQWLNHKLDKVFEQLDKTPAEIKEKVAIEEAECKAEFIKGCLFSELRLLRSGKLTTGLLANIIPVGLLDYANRELIIMQIPLLPGMLKHLIIQKKKRIC